VRIGPYTKVLLEEATDAQSWVSFHLICIDSSANYSLLQIAFSLSTEVVLYSTASFSATECILA